NLIDDFPVVHGIAGRIFGVGVRRTPLQRTRSIARGKQVVNANVRRRGTEPRDLAEQLFSIRRVGVVGLVVAEEVPDGIECTRRAVRMDLNGNLRRSFLRTQTKKR